MSDATAAKKQPASPRRPALKRISALFGAYVSQGIRSASHALNCTSNLASKWDIIYAWLNSYIVNGATYGPVVTVWMARHGVIRIFDLLFNNLYNLHIIHVVLNLIHYLILLR